MTILETYSHIGFTCLRESLEDVQSAVRRQLLRPDRTTRVHEVERELDLVRIYRDAPPLGGRHPKQVVLFSPSNSEQCSVMFANCADGWLTLTVCISKLIPGPAYRFAMSSDRDEWPLYRLEVVEAGAMVRHVSVIKDVDRWKFWQTGEPLPEEDVAVYKKRRIRDRLPREYLISLAERLGFPIGDDGFWQSDSKAVYFEEQRTAKSQSPPIRSP